MGNILSTGVSGLLAFQRALETTSHNIANVGTDGYTRQRVELTTRPASPYANGWMGNGVDVTSVRRVYDDVLATQARNSSSTLAQLDTFASQADSINKLFADTTTGLSASLQKFINAVQGVANTPTSVPARQVLLSEGQALVSRLNAYDQRLDELEGDINTRLSGEVAQINSDAQALARLNMQIVSGVTGTGQSPNDLLDQRDRLLKDLSERVGVSIVTADDGATNVFIGNGQPLVLGGTAATLATPHDPADMSRLTVVFQTSNGSFDVSSNLSGGAVGGLLDFRSQLLDPTRSQLGRIAAGLVDVVNEQHRAGIDLTGAMGGDFFSAGGVEVLRNTGNTGTASAAITRTDVGALTGHDYVLAYTGGAWNLQRDDGTSVSMTGSGTAVDPFVADGLSIVVSGTPGPADRFTVRPTSGVIEGMRVLVSDPGKIAAAAPIRTAAGTSNTGAAQISAGEVTDAADGQLRDPVTIRFLSPTTYSINGSGTYSYTSGTPIALNGWSATITGTPATGDTFTVSDNTSGVGDNRNALQIADVLGRGVLAGGTDSLDAAVGRFIGGIGVAAGQAQAGRDAQQAIHNDNVASLDAVTGVNLDEEAANLIKFQQAYQAAAQIIRVTDTLFQSLLDATR